MDFIWHKKIILWNFVALFIIKAVFSYSGSQFAKIIGDTPFFSKESIISGTNGLRINSGLSPVIENRALSLAADQKLQDMIKNQYFAHFSHSGISPWYWIEKNNYKYSYAGENLAIGFFSATDTVKAWSQSPSHMANLINPNYREIGVAVAQTKIQNNKGILVVQLFASPSPLVSTTDKKVKPIENIVSEKQVTASPTVSSATQVAKDLIIYNVSTSTPQIIEAAKKFNNTFIVYSFLLFLASVVMLVFRESRREFILRTGLHFALVIMALITPLLQTMQPAFIF